MVAHKGVVEFFTRRVGQFRLSGAGAWARDPDTIIVLTPHEEPDHFTVTSILRNLPQLPEFVVGWDYPLMTVASELNPEALRRPQSKNKVCSDKDFMDAVMTSEGKPFAKIVIEARSALKMSRSSVANYLKRLTGKGLIQTGGGLYWVQSNSPTCLK